MLNLVLESLIIGVSIKLMFHDEFNVTCHCLYLKLGSTMSLSMFHFDIELFDGIVA